MPLFWLSLAFLAGLVAGRGLLFPGWVWGLLALAAGALAILEIRRPLPFLAPVKRLTRLPLGALLALLLLGLARQAAALPQLTPAELAFYNDTGQYRLGGIVDQPPERGTDSQRLVIAVDELVALDEAGEAGPAAAVSGKLAAFTPIGTSFQYGDRVELEGELLRPALQNGFNPEQLAQQGIWTGMNYPHLRLLEHGAGSPLQALLYGVRQQARRVLQQILPMPESALLTGILLGIDDDLPDAVAASFRDTGTAHIWAISGFNIAILSGLVVTFFGRLLPRRRLAASLLAVGTISLYTLLVGASPPVVRAALMGTIGTFGVLIGRRQAGLNSLTFSAALMGLFEPLLPWSASFQLSFLATLGLIVLGDPLQRGFQAWLERRLGPDWAHRIGGVVGEYVLLTLAAQAATLPVTLITFGRVSLSAILANPLVLPIQPAVMVLGGLSLLGGMVALPIGQLLAVLAWPGLAYTIQVAGLLAKIQGGVLVGQIGPWAGAALCLGLGVLAAWLRWPGWWRQRLKPGVLLLGAALLAGAAWRALALAPDGRLHLVAIELGGPPAVLLRTPGGEFVVINGGENPASLGDELGRRQPLFASSLESWIITTGSSSPLEGLLDLSPRFTPRQVWLAESLAESTTRTNLLKRMDRSALPVSTLGLGQILELDGGVRLSLLAAVPDGAALLVEYGSFRALVPGGAPLNSLDGLGLAGAQALILGPADLDLLTPADWVQAVHPTLVAWSCPSPALSAPGWESLSARGWIEFSSDGNQLWVEAGK